MKECIKKQKTKSKNREKSNWKFKIFKYNSKIFLNHSFA